MFSVLTFVERRLIKIHLLSKGEKMPTLLLGDNTVTAAKFANSSTADKQVDVDVGGGDRVNFKANVEYFIGSPQTPLHSTAQKSPAKPF